MQQEQQQPQFNNEVSLKDLFNTLWQGKWVIIACVVVFVFIAVVYIKMVPQTYKGSLVVKTISKATELEYVGLFDLKSGGKTAKDLGQRFVDGIGNPDIRRSVLNQLNGESPVVGISVKGKAPTWRVYFNTQNTSQVEQWWSIAVPIIHDNVKNELKKEFVAQANAEISKLKENIALAITADISVNKELALTENSLPYLRGYVVLQSQLEELESRLRNLDSLVDKNFTAAIVNPKQVTMKPIIKPNLLILLAILFGGMIGVLIVVISKAIRR